MRTVEALGLWHEDIAAAERTVTVRPRLNANGARTKSVTQRTIPVSAELVRLFAEVLHREYGDLDSDYVFVNLWGHSQGRPLACPAIYALVRRLRRRTSIGLDPHRWRRTRATRLLRDGTPVEVVSTLMGRSSEITTARQADGGQAAFSDGGGSAPPRVGAFRRALPGCATRPQRPARPSGAGRRARHLA
ncbi:MULTISPECIES: tyrosine-type recombinase/integrase [unclassified Streptomyces]|uniref:tyrosine-type recombinase/integrase n=1 Tax=unclassified Streptomyces TaxID=2593676 RepID=UPI0033EB0F41